MRARRSPLQPQRHSRFAQAPAGREDGFGVANARPDDGTRARLCRIVSSAWPAPARSPWPSHSSTTVMTPASQLGPPWASRKDGSRVSTSGMGKRSRPLRAKRRCAAVAMTARVWAIGLASTPNSNHGCARRMRSSRPRASAIGRSTNHVRTINLWKPRASPVARARKPASSAASQSPSPRAPPRGRTRTTRGLRRVHGHARARPRPRGSAARAPDRRRDALRHAHGWRRLRRPSGGSQLRASRSTFNHVAASCGRSPRRSAREAGWLATRGAALHARR